MKCLKCQVEVNSIDELHYGLHHQCFTNWFNIPKTEEFIGLQKRSSTSDVASYRAAKNTSFFQGKFKKYSAELNGESYILKMRQKEAPELPEVEYLCNQIGSFLEIPVAEFYFINFNGDPVFVTKNFINGGFPTDLQHLYHFRADNQHNCEIIIQIIKEKTKRPHDVKTFINTLLFDALIGNHDRHGRNLAFIVTANRTLLAPIYDNVSYLSLEEGNMLKADFNPAGKIATQHTNEPSMRHYVKELKDFGFKSEVGEFLQKTKLTVIFNLIENSFCSDLMKQAMKNLISKRIKELEHEYAS